LVKLFSEIELSGKKPKIIILKSKITNRPQNEAVEK